MPKRRVIQADALDALARIQGDAEGIVTGLPDMAELPNLSRISYERWFIRAAAVTMAAAKPEGFSIFCQTDRKIDGQIISKADLLFQAARYAGVSTVWHKIVLRRAVGKVDFFRPTFCHLICFSKSGKAGRASPDLFPPEPLSWANGMPSAAIAYACRFTGAKIITDPFCGYGTVLAIANSLGLDAVGVDIEPEMVKRAKTFKLSLGDSN